MENLLNVCFLFWKFLKLDFFFKCLKTHRKRISEIFILKTRVSSLETLDFDYLLTKQKIIRFYFYT